MPKISYNKTGGTIVWGAQDWLAGLHPQYSTGSLTSIRFLTDKMTLQNSINPYRYLGAILPGALPTDATNVSQVTSFIRNSLVKGTSAYLIGSGSLVHKITTITSPLALETTNWPHTIDHSHTNEAGQDIILYNANVSSTPTQLMFYSFNDDTDWDVGMYNFASASTTFNDDFMSTVPATPLASPYLAGGKGYPHPLVVGDDDVLYMGDRNFLHAFDGQVGADGTFYAAVLTLPFGYVITSFARIENFLVIFAYLDNGTGSNYYLGNAKAFFWDYLSLDATKIIDLTDNFVSGGFQYKSTIGCFTQGRNENNLASKPSKMKLWNGSVFETKAVFDEAIPIQGGVEVLGDTINWNAGGVLYQYGTPYPEVIPTALNRIAAGGGTSGMLRTFTTVIQAMSSGATTSGGLQEIDVLYTGFSGSANAVLATAEPEFPFGFRGRIKTIRIQFAFTVSGLARNLVFRFVRSGTTSGTEITNLIADADNFNSTSINSLVKEFVIDRDGAPLPEFLALRPDLSWTTGTGSDGAVPVERIEVEYELVNYQVI